MPRSIVRGPIPPRYRIVKRNTNALGEIRKYPYYYAQRNILGVWIDLLHHPFINTFNSYDTDLSVVEEWLDDRINGKRSKTEEVVKEYE
jgi:hypothetical protein